METTNNHPNNQEPNNQEPNKQESTSSWYAAILVVFAAISLLVLLGAGISWVTDLPLHKSCVGVVLFIALVILSRWVRDLLDE